MSRPATFLFALLLGLPTSLAAPRPKEGDRTPLYYPTRMGAKWVYDDGKETTLEVTAVELKGGETIVTVSEGGPKGALHEKVAVSDKGVFRLERREYILDRFCLLMLPATEGKTWKFDYPQQGLLRGEKGTMTVGALEKIEVPAGKFTAVRVEIVVTAINGEPIDQRYTSWYAPEVGLVKMTQGTAWTKVLKSFTPGK
jgi:hypothetical protein